MKGPWHERRPCCSEGTTVRDNRRVKALVCIWKNNIVAITPAMLRHEIQAHLQLVVGEGLQQANISMCFIHTQTHIRNDVANYPAACSPIKHRLIFICFFSCGNFKWILMPVFFYFAGWCVSNSDGFGRENINMFDLVWPLCRRSKDLLCATTQPCATVC